ncbi:MAG: hypothetical protein Q9M31_10090 [Mariprofundus sp.]|nr:hypothetical protein [Mariprofundus sp.]
MIFLLAALATLFTALFTYYWLSYRPKKVLAQKMRLHKDIRHALTTRTTLEKIIQTLISREAIIMASLTKLEAEQQSKEKLAKENIEHLRTRESEIKVSIEKLESGMENNISAVVTRESNLTTAIKQLEAEKEAKLQQLTSELEARRMEVQQSMDKLETEMGRKVSALAFRESELIQAISKLESDMETRKSHMLSEMENQIELHREVEINRLSSWIEEEKARLQQRLEDEATTTNASA